MPDDQSVAPPTAHFPPADISPADFEEFVWELLQSTSQRLEDLTVTLHEKIAGTDGTYDFDATVRFRVAGMEFLVLVEAKRHANPIKRELVQVLHDKLRSVGGHKAVMISTAPYQRGALDYAAVHGIALATVTEGRYTYEARSVDRQPVMTREQARQALGLPVFVGHAYSPGDSPGSIRMSLLSPEHPDYVASELLGVDTDDTETS